MTAVNHHVRRVQSNSQRRPRSKFNQNQMPGISLKKKLLKILVTILFVIVVIFVSVPWIYYHLFPTLPMSQVLEAIDMYLTRLHNVDIRSEKMLREDPFQNLMNAIRPIVDKLASIRVQTGIYEKMERIPGGPQQFMTTTLTSLDRMLTWSLIFNKKSHLITVERGRKVTAIMSRELGALNLDFPMAMSNYNHQLQRHKIFIGYDESAGEIRDVTGPPISVIRILRCVNDLKENYIILEKLFPGVNTLAVLRRETDESKLTQEQKDVINTIAKITKTYGKIFKDILPYWSSKKAEFSIREDAIYAHQKLVAKKYEDLALGIELDILSTMERIRALAKPSSKRVEL